MSVNGVHRADLWRPQPDDAGRGVFDNVRECPLPRIKHLLVFLRFVPGLAVSEQWVTKPATFRHVDKSRCTVCDVGRDDSTVIVRYLRELGLRWNDENRLGAGGRLKQPALNVVRRKRRERSIELRARRRKLLEEVPRR